MPHIILVLAVLAILIGLACLLQWYQNHTKPLSTHDWCVIMRKHNIGVEDKTHRLFEGDPSVVGYSKKTPRRSKRNQSFPLAAPRPIIEIDRKTRSQKGTNDAKGGSNRDTRGGHPTHPPVYRTVPDGQRNTSVGGIANHSQSTGTNDQGTA